LTEIRVCPVMSFSAYWKIKMESFGWEPITVYANSIPKEKKLKTISQRKVS
jgi:hypothetical protein